MRCLQLNFLLASLVALPLLAPAQAGTWAPVGKGDCPGAQVWGTAGDMPEGERCTTEFIGKTALCFTQVCYPGCQYIDVLTKDCRGGTEMADVYTCVEVLPAKDPPAARP
jgi:hypothetical protein